MSISSWSVRLRLTIGFGLVCALMLVILGVGLLSVARVDGVLRTVVDTSVPKIDAAYTIEIQANNQSIAVRDMLLASDAADRQKQAEIIAQARTIAAKNVELLEQLIVMPKGKELLSKVKEQRSKYVAAQDALVAMITADKADEAKAYLHKELRPLLDSYMAGLTELAAFQTEAMDAVAKVGDETYRQARTVMLVLGVLALLVAAALGYFITRSLLKELGGEPGVAADLAQAVSQGDFTRNVVLQAGDTTSLMASLGTMQGNLAQIVTTVRAGSEGVATASAEIAQGNNDLSARTEQQASALEETAASMEELGSTVKQNADSARQANQLAQSASSVAVQGGKVVEQVVETMKGINESSRRIADIISVIDGIAFQTNILALNAAVEAARAGEQGRGFAVVASEVRSLAGRSAEAAKEIKQLINASVERVEHGSALVDQAGTTMTEVVDSIRRVTDIMGEISAASSEQASGVAQVGEAVTQMDQATQQNAALVEEMAAAAGALKGQAQELVQAVAFFKLGASTSQAPSLPRTAVRAPAAQAKPFKGEERRAIAASSAAAARKPAATAPQPAAPKPAAAAAPKTQSKPAPAGGDDDWETF
ncbi:MCP four helix bundle domain-containing protein [Rhodoferax sp. AJA081-3]|uniref:methyl-accepting chemotaxis protein n=1 Tax=Rhodoferax sp. AJA081-3 TaxID=2752316 RepID=UPI001ADF11B3|nr:methyl-accepting chemotaxis protein [Rhodoferax sp. AJA081-3]QTN30362.1 MCP four helix bundle domain-containing protein [Rhodoferax sp. AJA081-3]